MIVYPTYCFTGQLEMYVDDTRPLWFKILETFFTLESVSDFLIMTIIFFIIIAILAAVVKVVHGIKKKNNGSETELEIYPEDNSLWSKAENPYEIDDKESLLPDWLKERKEMIFPNESIEKYQEIGRGQFGTVLKAKLAQGQAV